MTVVGTCAQKGYSKGDLEFDPAYFNKVRGKTVSQMDWLDSFDDGCSNDIVHMIFMEKVLPIFLNSTHSNALSTLHNS